MRVFLEHFTAETHLNQIPYQRMSCLSRLARSSPCGRHNMLLIALLAWTFLQRKTAI